MKFFLKLTIILILVCQAYYSQQNSKLRIKQENSKGFSLKVRDLTIIEKNGGTSWAVTSVLINHSRDTLLYFIIADCEPDNFMAIASVETVTLFPDFECDTANKQTVVALPPSGQRTVNLVISSKTPVTSSFEFKILLLIYRANNKYERISYYNLIETREREIFLVSNRIKIKSQP
jgi:hypothetical protein